MFLRRCVVALVLLCFVSGLSGCAGFTAIGKELGLITPPPFIIDQPIPEEFQFSMTARDVANPAIDYEFQFSRNGRLDCEVTVRSPVRFSRQERFELPESEIFRLWTALQEAQFDRLPAQYVAETPVIAAGVRTFWVSLGEVEKRVEAHYTRPKVLFDLQKKVLDLVPGHMLSVKEGARSPTEAPEHYVGDTKTKIFYASDAEQLSEVPEERRRIFETKYEALDHAYSPDPESDPMSRPDKN